MNNQDKPTYRKLLLFAIKYAPSVLAISCSVKIFLLSQNDTPKNAWLYGVNWINWLTNILALAAFYIMGRYFGYCWKHRSLCRLAMWGYLYYAWFLIFSPPHDIITPLAYMYVAVVIVFTALYKRI